MARLIDADDLRETLDSVLNWETNNEYNMYSDTMDVIDDAPTVDAVEVVRCKDCKYFKAYTDILTGRKAYYCKYKDGNFVGSEMHYCSYGERRDGNAAD